MHLHFPVFLVYFNSDENGIINLEEYEFGHKCIKPRQVVKCTQFISRYIPLFKKILVFVKLCTIFDYDGIFFIIGTSPFENNIEFVLGANRKIAWILCSHLNNQQVANLFNIFDSNKELFGAYSCYRNGPNIICFAYPLF